MKIKESFFDDARLSVTLFSEKENLKNILFSIKSEKFETALNNIISEFSLDEILDLLFYVFKNFQTLFDNIPGERKKQIEGYLKDGRIDKKRFDKIFDKFEKEYKISEASLDQKNKIVKSFKEALKFVEKFVEKGAEGDGDASSSIKNFLSKVESMLENKIITISEEVIRGLIVDILFESSEKIYKDPGGDASYVYKRSDVAPNKWVYKKNNGSWKPVNSAGAKILDLKYGVKKASEKNKASKSEEKESLQIPDRLKNVIDPKFEKKYKDLIPIAQEFPDDKNGLRMMDAFRGAGKALQALSYIIGTVLSPVDILIDKITNIPVHFVCLGRFLALRTRTYKIRDPKLKRAMYYVCLAAEKRGGKTRKKSGEYVSTIGYVDYMSAQKLDPEVSTPVDTWGGRRKPSLKTNNPYVALSVTFGKSPFRKNSNGSYTVADRYDYNLNRGFPYKDSDYVNSFANLKGMLKKSKDFVSQKQLVAGIEELLVAYEVYLGYKGYPVVMTTSKPK